MYISSTGTVWQKFGVGKWKKIGVLAFQKVAKTGNIGKKSPVASDIDYVRYLSMQKVKGKYRRNCLIDKNWVWEHEKKKKSFSGRPINFWVGSIFLGRSGDSKQKFFMVGLKMDNILLKAVFKSLCYQVHISPIPDQQLGRGGGWGRRGWGGGGRRGGGVYRNGPKFSDGQVWANSVDPYQIRPLLSSAHSSQQSICQTQ